MKTVFAIAECQEVRNSMFLVQLCCHVLG